MSIETKTYRAYIKSKEENPEVSFNFLCKECGKQRQAVTSLEQIEERGGYIVETCLMPCDALNVLYLRLMVEVKAVVIPEEAFGHE